MINGNCDMYVKKEIAPPSPKRAYLGFKGNYYHSIYCKFNAFDFLAEVLFM